LATTDFMEFERLIAPFMANMSENRMFQLVMVLIIMDVIFGCLRAIKEHTFNTTIGIDGMIRKAGMLTALFFLVILDHIVRLNLIGFIPEAGRQTLGIEAAGMMEFFAIIFSVYESISVLKNMSLCGLPVKKVWLALQKWLKENTGEFAQIPGDEEEEVEKVNPLNRYINIDPNWNN